MLPLGTNLQVTPGYYWFATQYGDSTLRLTAIPSGSTSWNPLSWAMGVGVTGQVGNPGYRVVGPSGQTAANAPTLPTGVTSVSAPSTVSPSLPYFHIASIP
jgi:hypothetical protein